MRRVVIISCTGGGAAEVAKVLENAREAGRLSRKMELLDGVATTRVRMTSMLLRKLMVLSMSESERLRFDILVLTIERRWVRKFRRNSIKYM